jgi:hypothetical protein
VTRPHVFGRSVRSRIRYAIDGVTREHENFIEVRRRIVAAPVIREEPAGVLFAARGLCVAGEHLGARGVKSVDGIVNGIVRSRSAQIGGLELHDEDARDERAACFL